MNKAGDARSLESGIWRSAIKRLLLYHGHGLNKFFVCEEVAMVARRKRGVPLSETPENTQAALEQRAAAFDPTIHGRKEYGDKTKALRSLVERRWNE